MAIMNAIIITAIWGIVMMFGGVFFKRKSTPKYWAIAGLILASFANFIELKNQHHYLFESLISLRFLKDKPPDFRNASPKLRFPEIVTKKCFDQLLSF